MTESINCFDGIAEFLFFVLLPYILRIELRLLVDEIFIFSHPLLFLCSLIQ